MAYEPHPVFKTPPRDTIIWRYINLERLLDMCERDALYFSSVSALAKYDAYEGAMSEVNAAIESVRWEELPAGLRENLKSEEMFEKYKLERRRARPIVLGQRQITFVNCWHAQNAESSAMWRLYTNDQKGIAIRTTCGRLIESVANYKDFSIFVGLITYIDYFKDTMDERNGFTPFVHKRVQFKHESELRAVVWTAENGKYSIHPERNPYSQQPGIYVGADLDKLIDAFVLGPEMEDWEISLIKTLIKDYGINKPILRSVLSTKPTS